MLLSGVTISVRLDSLNTLSKTGGAQTALVVDAVNGDNMGKFKTPAVVLSGGCTTGKKTTTLGAGTFAIWRLDWVFFHHCPFAALRSLVQANIPRQVATKCHPSS
jgi:hypothetical protein